MYNLQIYEFFDKKKGFLFYIYLSKNWLKSRKKCLILQIKILDYGYFHVSQAGDAEV